MNVLVTGADGFIGKHVCPFLERQRHHVFKLALDLTNNAEVVKFSEEFKNKHTIDVVIHLAAKMANVNQDFTEQFKSLYDNLEITKNVVALVKILKPQKLINFSSMAVYPNVDGVFSEDARIHMSENSDCLYGLAKFCGENIFECFLKNQNIVITHLRISQVYGGGMCSDRIMPIMQQELKEKNVITVYGEGERISNFINIDKLLEVLGHFFIEKLPGVYNIGGESLGYMEIAKRIIKERGDEKSSIIRIKKGSQVKFILDTKKLEEKMNEFKKGEEKYD